MKKQALAKLRTNTTLQLDSKLIELKTQLVNTAHQIKIGKKTNVKEPSAIRHQIAIIKQIIKQRELETPTQDQ